MKSLLKRAVLAFWGRVTRLAAPSYIVGPELDDVLRACHRVAKARMSTTVSYWNSAEEGPELVASAYRAAIEAIGLEKLDSYVSIKAPFIGYDRRLFREILELGRSRRVRLLFDAQAPDLAEESLAMIKEALPKYGDLLGCAIPGRWRRSLKDADWAVERRLFVRVVKGQLADPEMPPDVDLREAYMAVIERLAGRARHVGVATHDAPLAQQALERLLKAKTPCELELLYGLPWEPALSVARTAGVGVRLYLPYGHGWLPYWLAQGYKNPKVLWWVLRDMCRIRSGRRLPGGD